MNKLKVITVVGTRPEIIRMSCIIKKVDKYFNHILVHTGQNWDKNLNDVFFDDLDLRKPDHYLDVVGKNLGESIGNIISKSYNLFSKLDPDALLILGDTNSALVSISAKRLKIPIFHMEAGNRCFDQNVPEEINRKIIDHISDINLCYTENSRRYLLSEGFRKDHIFVTGTPLTEVIHEFKNKIEKNNILNKLDIVKNKYIVLSVHREENIDILQNFTLLIKSINNIAEQYQLPIIFSVHPRTRKKLNDSKTKLHQLIKKIDPLGYFDYCKLQMNSCCVVSDSGTVTEESTLLNFPAISLRTSTERPEGIDNGNIIISSIMCDNVIESIELAVGVKSDKKSVPYDYIDKNVSTKIVKIIQSYVPAINKFIYMKH